MCYDSGMTHSCIDCGEQVSFPTQPGEARCPACGLALYVTSAGQVGRLPDEQSFRGGV